MNKFDVYVNGKKAGQIEAANINEAKAKSIVEFPTTKGKAYPVAVGMPSECVLVAKAQSRK